MDYKELKLRVNVKLKLKILKMRVGIVIVAKLSAHTNILVTLNINDAMNLRIQPITPCERAISTGDAGVARTVFTMLLIFWTVTLSAMEAEIVSIASAIVLFVGSNGPTLAASPLSSWSL